MGTMSIVFCVSRDCVKTKNKRKPIPRYSLTCQLLGYVTLQRIRYRIMLFLLVYNLNQMIPTMMLLCCITHQVECYMIIFTAMIIHCVLHCRVTRCCPSRFPGRKAQLARHRKVLNHYVRLHLHLGVPHVPAQKTQIIVVCILVS